MVARKGKSEDEGKNNDWEITYSKWRTYLHLTNSWLYFNLTICKNYSLMLTPYSWMNCKWQGRTVFLPCLPKISVKRSKLVNLIFGNIKVFTIARIANTSAKQINWISNMKNINREKLNHNTKNEVYSITTKMYIRGKYWNKFIINTF